MNAHHAAADTPVDLIEIITRFCRALRQHGVVVTPGDSVQAVRALDAVDLTDRRDVYLALRTVLVTRVGDIAVFDDLFNRWWHPGGTPHARDTVSEKAQRPPRARNPAVHTATDEPPRPAASAFLTRWIHAGDAVDGERSVALAAPSTREPAGGKDFSHYTADELSSIERVAARIARRLRARRSRRWRSAARGSRIDLRRLVRLSLKTGGDPIELARRERKLRRTRLMVLCDVSGSMDLYSRFLLQVLFALQHSFARVETFAFSTRLVQITGALARDTYRDALDALARLPGRGASWSGGTKIGESLAAFYQTWHHAIDRRTVVLILSDGWDTGAPELLGGALRDIHARAGRVVWLNPLLGSPTYQPLTRGMQAALPHIDVFAPAHDVASLERLAEHLSL